jgi:hypothetical protein
VNLFPGDPDSTPDTEGADGPKRRSAGGKCTPRATAVLSARTLRGLSAAAALDASTRLWLVVNALGQWIFVACIAAFYGRCSRAATRKI